MSHLIEIPRSLAHRAREIHGLIDEQGLRDELAHDAELEPDEVLTPAGLLVGGKSFDPTLPFGGRLRGEGKGVRVGDGCYNDVNYPAGSCGMPPVIDPCTFRAGQRICDMQKVAKSIVIAGGTYRELTIEPRKASYMDPKGIRARVTALNDTTLEFDALVTLCAINDIPQEGTNQSNPTVPTVAGNTIEGWWVSDWRYPTKHAVPVSWGWFSNVANSYPLTIGTLALGVNANVLLLVTYNVYGNLMTAPPDGRGPGISPNTP